MGIFDNYFRLGLGTGRLCARGPADFAGIEKSAQLVCEALEAGLNYVDSAYPYVAGTAPNILKEAFARTTKRFGVTSKVMYGDDKTADDARRRFEFHVGAMGLERAEFFVCWTIASYEIFTKIMRKGGIYDGALKLKDEGLIDHICFSTHALPDDNVKIIQSGAFEAMTISHSMLNAAQNQHVLDAALEHNVEVVAMNPLGGGIIAQNPDFFSFARANEAESTVAAALRFVKAHPAVKIILSGISSELELDENLRVFTETDPEPGEKRLIRVKNDLREVKGFCTGCDYCAGCPQGIPVSELMKNRNKMLFGGGLSYNRSDPELIKNINLFYTHRHLNSGEWFPETPDNPCIKCGDCEEKCTQKLKIIDAIADTYERAAKVGFSHLAQVSRLKELLVGKNYKKVGLYPNGGFSEMVQSMYLEEFGTPEFEWILFNSDPKMWGQFSSGLTIHAPDEIAAIRPDIIIVCTYRYDADIFSDLRHYQDEGIEIVKLHHDTDVPWIF